MILSKLIMIPSKAPEYGKHPQVLLTSLVQFFFRIGFIVMHNNKFVLTGKPPLYLKNISFNLYC